jgi:hypothetical protein
MKYLCARAPLFCLVVAACSQAAVKPIDRGGVTLQPDAAPVAGSRGAGGSGGAAGAAGAGGTGGAAGTAGAAATAGTGGGGAVRMDAARPDRPPPPPPRPRPDAQPPDAAEQNKQVLFVTGSMGMILSDMTMIDRLTSRGFMVTVRTDMAVRDDDAEGKGAVLLSGSTSLANIMASFPQAPDLEVPMLAMDENLEPFLNLTALADTDHGTTNGTQVAILGNAPDALKAGLSGTVTVFTVEFNISWGVPGPDAQRVATVAGNPNEAALYVYDEGDDMANDEEAPAKRAFFFVRDSPTANLMTEDALKLFDGVVDFLTKP